MNPKITEWVEIVTNAVLGYGVLSRFGLGGKAVQTSAASATGAAKAEEGMKANPLGIGLNDEALFSEAVTLAEQLHLMRIPEGRNNLSKLMKSLGYWGERRFYQMIGLTSQKVTIKPQPPAAPAVPAAPPAPATGRRRAAPAAASVPPQEITFDGNIKGALLVAFYGNMTPKAAKAFLDNSGILNGTWDDVVKVWEGLKKFYDENADFKTFQSAVKVRSREAILRYLGAVDCINIGRTEADCQAAVTRAEGIVAVRMQEAKDYRAQSWYQRTLKQHPYYLIALAVAGGIIILGIVQFAYWGGPTN